MVAQSKYFLDTTPIVMFGKFLDHFITTTGNPFPSDELKADGGRLEREVGPNGDVYFRVYPTDAYYRSVVELLQRQVPGGLLSAGEISEAAAMEFEGKVGK